MMAVIGDELDQMQIILLTDFLNLLYSKPRESAQVTILINWSVTEVMSNKLRASCLENGER